MKKLLVYLLCFSMVLGNCTFAMAEESSKTTEDSTTEEQAVKKTEEGTSKETTQETTKTPTKRNVTGATAPDIVTSLGHFPKIDFQNVDEDDISTDVFRFTDEGKTEVSSTSDVISIARDDTDEKKGFYIEAKAVGKTTVRVDVSDDESISFVVEVKELEDGIVPFKDYELFSSISNEYYYDSEIEDSVKINEDDSISVKEVENVSSIFAGNAKDLTGIEYVTNCDYFSIYKDDSEVDYSPLIKIKNSIERIDFPTSVSDSMRAELMVIDEVSIAAGKSKKLKISPQGLLRDTDQVSVTSDSSDKIEVEKNQIVFENDGAAYILLKGIKQGNAAITITMGEVTKEIPVTVQEGTGNAAFANPSKNVTIGSFQKFEFLNFESDKYDQIKVDLQYDKEGILDIITEGNKYIPVGKKTGTVTVSGTVEGSEGVISDITPMTFTVSEDKDVVPIVDYNLFDSMYNDWYNADENDDGKLSYLEAEKVTHIKSWDEIMDLSGIQYLTNCEKIELKDWTGNDISPLYNLTKLKSLNIESANVTASDIKQLSSYNQLEELHVNSGVISFSERLGMIRNTNILIEEGTKTKNALLPKGLVVEGDVVTIEDGTNLKANIDDGNLVLDATKAKLGEKATLVVSNEDNSERKEFQVTVTAKSENTPQLSLTSNNVKLYSFPKIAFENEEGMNISFQSSDENVLKVREYTYRKYIDDDDETEITEWYFEPKHTGTATVTAEFTKNGETYFDAKEMTVTAADEDIVPLLSAVTYKRLKTVLYDNEIGCEVDRNQDNQISIEEIKAARSINVSGQDLSNEDLNGLEYAVNLEDVILCSNITNIDFLKKLTKLKYVNLDSTGVSAEDKFDLIPDKDIELNVGAIKNVVNINGLSSKGDFNYEVTNGNEAKVQLRCNKGINEDGWYWGDDYTIEGLEEGDTILTVTLGDLTKTIKVHVIPADPDAVDIPDSTLREELISASGSEKGYLTKEDMKKVKDLSFGLEGKELDLTGIEYATNLESLEIYGQTSIKNFDKLYEIDSLKSLYLCNVSDQDISSIAKMTNLQSLCLRGDFSDARALNTMDQLTDLILRSDKLKTLPSVAQMTKLKEVALEGIFDNISTLNTLRNLDYLSLSSEKLTDLSPLQNVGSVNELHLYESTNITDVLPLCNVDIESMGISEHVSTQSLLKFFSASNKIKAKGEHIFSDVSIVDENGCGINPVRIKSDNPYVVDDRGYGVGIGETQIEVSVTGLSDSAQVNPLSEKIKVKITGDYSLNSYNLEVGLGKTSQLKVSETKLLTNYLGNVTWKSKDTSIAPVDENGTVTGNKLGSTIIYAKLENGESLSCNVTVKEKVIEQPSTEQPTTEQPTTEQPTTEKPTTEQPTTEKPTTEQPTTEKPTTEQPTTEKPTTPTVTKVTKVAITGDSHKIAAGKKITLKANVTPANANNKKVTWKSSNTKVATVNGNGVVTMKKKTGGKKVTITAVAQDGSGKSAKWALTSMKGVVKKIKISGKTIIKAGKTLKLKAKVTASKGAYKSVKWTCNNTKYATVSGGKVKAKKEGKGKKVKITVQALDGSGKKKTITIKIK